MKSGDWAVAAGCETGRLSPTCHETVMKGGILEKRPRKGKEFAGPVAGRFR
jgi:hypothetical protein